MIRQQIYLSSPASSYPLRCEPISADRYRLFILRCVRMRNYIGEYSNTSPLKLSNQCPDQRRACLPALPGCAGLRTAGEHLGATTSGNRSRRRESGRSNEKGVEPNNMPVVNSVRPLLPGEIDSYRSEAILAPAGRLRRPKRWRVLSNWSSHLDPEHFS